MDLGTQNSALKTQHSFEVRLEVFEGPLDLLLKLIERKQLEISKVALAEVAEGFLTYLEAHPNMPPGPLRRSLRVGSEQTPLDKVERSPPTAADHAHGGRSRKTPVTS